MRDLTDFYEAPDGDGKGAFVLTWIDKDQAAAFTGEIDGIPVKPGTNFVKSSELRKYTTPEERSRTLREIQSYSRSPVPITPPKP